MRARLTSHRAAVYLETGMFRKSVPILLLRIPMEYSQSTTIDRRSHRCSSPRRSGPDRFRRWRSRRSSSATSLPRLPVRRCVAVSPKSVRDSSRPCRHHHRHAGASVSLSAVVTGGTSGSSAAGTSASSPPDSDLAAGVGVVTGVGVVFGVVAGVGVVFGVVWQLSSFPRPRCLRSRLASQVLALRLSRMSGTNVPIPRCWGVRRGGRPPYPRRPDWRRRSRHQR